MLYAALSGLVGSFMLVGWLLRTELEINVLHDRNPPFVRLTDGSIRNGYTVKLLNKQHEPRSFKLDVRRLEGARLTVVGQEQGGEAAVSVPTDTLREIRVLVTMPRDKLGSLAGASTPFDLVIRDVASNKEAIRSTRFQRP
jgi:polyferredoxin